MTDFETKLAAAGDTLEKLAAERGLSLSDFTEQETVDLLSTIMGEGGAPPAEGPKVAYAAPAPAKVASAAPQLTYGQVMAEVVKVASANGYDITRASPAELDDAVQKMAALLSNPEFMAKQAAMQEKIAEADAMGRVMAHSYVDELGRLAKVAEDKKEEAKEEAKEEKDEEKEEKKASLVRALRGQADEGDFAKAASARASEMLIVNGINPATGTKFASEQEAVDAAATLLLQQKGYI